MARKDFSQKEKKIWRQGFFAGLGKVKKRSPTKKNKVKKEYSFSAFNENCDVFNVKSKGYSRSDALSNAKKQLKRDPECPVWGVTITNAEASPDHYRSISILDDGSVFDNWRYRYRSEDNSLREKYKDLSKPVDGYKYD